MADRSHLVRTPITDRTGKQTTVYRRPASAPASTTRFPAAGVSAARRSGMVRLQRVFDKLRPGGTPESRERTFVALCEESEAIVIADACEASPGFTEVLLSQITFNASGEHEAAVDPSMIACIARLYEDGAVTVPEATTLAGQSHALYDEYAAIIDRIDDWVRDAGPVGARPIFTTIDERHVPLLKGCVRACSKLRDERFHPSDAGRVIKEILTGECTAEGIMAALAEHGRQDAQQIIAIAKGVPAAASSGWL